MRIYDLTNCPYSNRNGSYGGAAGDKDGILIDGIVLDVFIYPLETFQSEFDPEEFVQVWDGKIILDTEGIAARLKKRVLDYIAKIPQKAEEEIQQELSWCEKCCPEQCAGMLRGITVGIGCWLTVWRYTSM